MKQKTKISVGVITYKQQTTIAQTLDSILTQKGDFDLEIVVGEDCSTDNTRAICEEYVRCNELRNERVNELRDVKLLPNTHNLGIMANFARVMKACTGDYVGICAGDDYWCDEYKLQKQLNYFQKHPDVGVVSTSGYRYYILRDEMVPGVAPLQPIEDGDIKKFYFSPNYRGGVYAMPLSLLIKRELLQYVDFDEFVKRGFPVEDYPMQAILAQHTKWGHINDLCVVYRVYKESATFISFDHPKYLQYHKGLANIRRYLNELFPEDAFFREEWLQEYEFYKEFLLYLHKFNYKDAKQLITEASEMIPDSSKLKQAKRFSKTYLHFIAAHYIKERAYRKDLRERVYRLGIRDMKQRIVNILSAVFQAIDTLLCRMRIKRPTVVMYIDGGICSQMLQYIQGQYYQDVADVYFDIDGYKDWSKQSNGLDARFFELTEMYPDLPFKAVSKLQRKWYVLFFNMARTNADWLPEPSSVRHSMYLNGWWDLPSADYKSLFEQFLDVSQTCTIERYCEYSFENIVGIHVRRGDLAKGDNPVYGGVTDGYFLRAIEFCNKQFQPKKYMFFSDEPDWVEANICPHVKSPYEIIRGNKAWEDLWLLAHCPIIVASQGSFGRVAAQLNPDAILIQCDNEHANRERKNTYLIK